MNRSGLSAPSTLSAAPAAPARWRLVAGVFKLRIGTLIMVTALGGMAIVPEGDASALQAFVLALSVLVASAAAGAFNQFVEADSDRLMKRTRQRAFASGALDGSAWKWVAAMAGVVMLVVAAVRVCPIYSLIGVRTCPAA